MKNVYHVEQTIDKTHHLATLWTNQNVLKFLQTPTKIAAPNHCETQNKKLYVETLPLKGSERYKLE